MMYASIIKIALHMNRLDSIQNRILKFIFAGKLPFTNVNLLFQNAPEVFNWVNVGVIIRDYTDLPISILTTLYKN